MSEPSASPPPPRQPVIVRPAAPRSAPAPAPRPAAAPRVMSTGNAPPPVPGSIMRCLLSTRAWALLCAFGLIIIGIVQIVSARKAWADISTMERLTPEDLSTAERLLGITDTVVHFALALACLYAVPKLFRYAGAIARLREARRMAELENALRHQRAVWRVFGAAGILWLLSFIGSLIYLVGSLRELAELRESADDASEFEMTE